MEKENVTGNASPSDVVVVVFGVWVKALIEVPPLVSRSPFPQDAEEAGNPLVGKRPQGWQGALGKGGSQAFL